MRSGRLDNTEQAYIRANIKEMHYETIAAILDRDPKSIKLWIEKNLGFTASDRKEVEAYNELKDKAYWKDLEGQFSEDELEMFVFHWKKMWSQFKDDVFHTEEIQIVDTIKLEILMNRCLRAQNENIKQAAELEKLMADLKKEMIGMLDHHEKDEAWKDVANIARQVSVLVATREALSRDFKDLQTKKSSMIKDLKGTREQRIKAIEDSKQTFGALIKKIILDSDFRREVGLEMEKMRLAMDKERERLSEAHTYEDGVIDQPFLTPETVEG